VAAEAGRRRGGPLAACRADMQSLCGDIERGRGARKSRLECLVENRDKASPACAAAIAEVEAGQPGDGRARKRREAGTRGAMAACRTDVATHCGNIEPGSGGRMRCLRENAAKLTPECTAVLNERRTAAVQTRRALRAACEPDAALLCSGIERQSGGLRRCLAENTAKLSPACAEAVAQGGRRDARG